MMHDFYWNFAFNVLVNSTLVFFTSVMLIEACLFLFRVKQPRIKALCRSIPILKLCLDLFLYNFTAWALWHGVNPIEAPAGTRSLSAILGLASNGLSSIPIFDSGIQLHLNNGMTFTLADLALLSFNVFWIKFIVAIAFAGSIGFCLIKTHGLARSYRRIKLIVNNALPCTRGIINAALQLSISRSKVNILVSSFVNVPCAIGIFKKKVVFPASLINELTQDEFEAIIAHEMAHLRWYDAVCRIFLNLISAFYWWIPCKWWQARIEQNQEMACDVYVSSFKISRTALANAIVKSIKKARTEQLPVLAMGFVKESHYLVRMKAILTESTPRKLLLWKILKNCLIACAMTAICFGKFWIF